MITQNIWFITDLSFSFPFLSFAAIFLLTTSILQSNCATAKLNDNVTISTSLQQQLRSNCSPQCNTSSSPSTATAQQQFTHWTQEFFLHQQLCSNCSPQFNTSSNSSTFNNITFPWTETATKSFSRQLTTANFVPQQLRSNCSPQCNNSIFPSTRNSATRIYASATTSSYLASAYQLNL